MTDFKLGKVSIIIPVFNEATTVVELLERVMAQKLPGNLAKEMVIIESNSKDSSRELVKKFVEKNKGKDVGINLILQDLPRGKGNAVRHGLEVASGDIILIQDADLEYDIEDYPNVIQPILEGHACFVLGSRHLSAGSWKIRNFDKTPFRSTVLNFGGVLFHALFNVVFGVTLTDPTTMYKVFKAECIKGIVFECDRFDFDFELLAKLLNLGYAPLEVPVSYNSRSFEEGKKVTMVRDPITWLIAILKFRFKRIKRLPAIEQERQLKLVKEKIS